MGVESEAVVIYKGSFYFKLRATYDRLEKFNREVFDHPPPIPVSIYYHIREIKKWFGNHCFNPN